MVLVNRISSAVDHFQSLECLVGMRAQVETLTPSSNPITAKFEYRVIAHLEGIITYVGNPPGRECYTDELRIQIGEEFIDAEVHAYVLDDSVQKVLSITGYKDNDSKSVQITAYYNS